MNYNDNRWACITGATSGLGNTFAEQLAAEGCNLILNGRNETRLQENGRRLQDQFGIQIIVVAADLSVPKDRQSLYDTILECPNLEYLVNNAGFGNKSNFPDGDLQELTKMVRVHIDASTELIHYAVPKMEHRGGGFIINVSSLGGFFPSPTDCLYSSTKSYLTVLSESLSIMLRPKNIRIQALCPGFVRTEFHDRLNLSSDFKKNHGIFRWMSAEKVVKTSLRLVKRKKQVIVIPGAFYKLLYAVGKFLPRKVYYSQAKKVMKNRVSVTG